MVRAAQRFRLVVLFRLLSRQRVICSGRTAHIKTHETSSYVTYFHLENEVILLTCAVYQLRLRAALSEIFGLIKQPSMAPTAPLEANCLDF